MANSRKKSGGQKKTANVAKHYTPKVEVTEEEKKYFDEHYKSKHLIVNILHIWKDSAPKGFITFFPVMVLYLAYCVLWFLINMLLAFPSCRDFCIDARNLMLQISPFVSGLGLPIALTYLHAKYNIRNEIYYFLKNLFYIIPATFISILLCYLNFVVAVMFEEGAGAFIGEIFKGSWLAYVCGLASVLLCGAVAQAIMMARKAREEALTTPLGLIIPKKKKKK